MKKNANKGFSLVELIIVIAIMAVLIGVLAPQFIKQVEKSKEAKDITNLDSCVEAVKVYYADRETTTTTITISGTKGSAFSGDANALNDAGAGNSIVTGKWGTDGTGSISATINLTTGEVTYKGDGQYYEAKAADGTTAAGATGGPSFGLK